MSRRDRTCERARERETDKDRDRDGERQRQRDGERENLKNPKINEQLDIKRKHGVEFQKLPLSSMSQMSGKVSLPSMSCRSACVRACVGQASEWLSVPGLSRERRQLRSKYRCRCMGLSRMAASSRGRHCLPVGILRQDNDNDDR